MLIFKKILIGLLLLVTYPVSAANILIVGDSLSAGYGIDVKKGWAALLQKRLQEMKLDYQVQNASISGDTTSNGLSRLPTALKQYQPVITIIELGGNDGLRGIPLTVIQKNLSQMVALAKQQKSKVLLLGVRLPPNYGPEYTQKFQHIFLQEAKHSKVSVVPLFLAGIDDQNHLIQADGIHPQESAQAQMLENVWKELRTMMPESSQNQHSSANTNG